VPLASALRVKRFTLPDGINAAREQELSRRIIHTVWRQTARGRHGVNHEHENSCWRGACPRRRPRGRRTGSCAELGLPPRLLSGLRLRAGVCVAFRGLRRLCWAPTALSVATPGVTMEVRIPQRGTFNASERCAGLRNPDQRCERAGAAMVGADATSDLTAPASVPCSWPGIPIFFLQRKERGGRTNPMARQ
jgi:hypothetical protein